MPLEVGALHVSSTLAVLGAAEVTEEMAGADGVPEVALAGPARATVPSVIAARVRAASTVALTRRRVVERFILYLLEY